MASRRTSPCGCAALATKSLVRNLEIALFAGCLFLSTGASGFAIFQGAGPSTGAIQPIVDAFRAALGNPNNGNDPGPLDSGRREINWDGGGPPVVDGTPPVAPFTIFANTRGATFTTPGFGLTQAADTGGLLSLDIINPTYGAIFAPFSPNRLFTPIGSNITDGIFSIPGTGGFVPAGVTGFGAIFSDVDLPVSSIQYFDRFGGSIGSFVVPEILGNETFSFLGLLLGPGEGLIARVRLTTGNIALGPNESSVLDLVVMDDFIYAEPQRFVPEPRTVDLLIAGLVMLSGVAWRTRRHGVAAPR